MSNRQYRNKEWLLEQYTEKKKTTTEMAEQAGVSQSTIVSWMDKHDIDRRNSGCRPNNNTPTFISKTGDFGDLPGGYMIAVSARWDDGETHTSEVRIHQLVAIADGADPYKVFSGGEYHCHHKNEIRWDNRPENIEFLTAAEHGKVHSKDIDRSEGGNFR